MQWVDILPAGFYTHETTIKLAQIQHTQIFNTQACAHIQHSHNISNISSIKTQHSLNSVGRGRDKQTGLWRRSAVRHKSSSEKTAHQEGTGASDKRVRQWKTDSKRKQGQGRGWRPKQISYINLSVASFMAWAHVLYQCVSSYYKAAGRFHLSTWVCVKT